MPDPKDIKPLFSLTFFYANRSELIRLGTDIRKLTEADEHGYEFPLVSIVTLPIYLSAHDFAKVTDCSCNDTRVEKGEFSNTRNNGKYPDYVVFYGLYVRVTFVEGRLNYYSPSGWAKRAFGTASEQSEMQIIAIFYLTLEVILALAFVAAHIFSAFVELLCPPVKYLRKHFKIPSQGKPQSKNSTSAVSVRVPTPSESAAAPSPTMPPLPPPPCLVSRYHWPFVLSILFS